MRPRYRLPFGGRIDRGRPITFRFDGAKLQGFDGDTVASALLANGVRLVARSLRLHRGRGVMASGAEEPNALMHVRIGAYEEPNVRATLMPLQAGLEVFSQNAWPHRRCDIAQILDWLPKLWIAGSFYQTFIWPKWSAYEPIVRRLAGTGRIRTPGAGIGSVSQQDRQVDVLVCGGGIAGRSAAQAAHRRGASVLLLDDDAELGGPIPGVQVISNSIALGVFGDKVVLALENAGWDAQGPRRCLWRLRARALVLASGSLEQPMVFEHNDRPGVMLAGAVTRYLERYAVRAGDIAALITNNDQAYSALADWYASGIRIAALIDSRSEPGPIARACAAALKLPIITSPQWVSVRGRTAVRGLRYRDSAGRQQQIACDLVAMSGGWIPNVSLFSQAQGRLQYDPGLNAYAPVNDSPGVYAVGAAAGLSELVAVERHAGLAGSAAADCALSGTAQPPELPGRPAAALGLVRFGGAPHRQWLDFQHDVTVADVASAIEQGYTQVEHFKRYTTTGMAADQGKTSLRNALEQLAVQSGQPMHQLHPPTFRPPYVPLPMAVAAGPNVGVFCRPERRLPCHDQHVALRAHFEDASGWRRPMYYDCLDSGTPRIAADAVRKCIQDEVRAVRSAVGLFDASSLGKFEVSGPDAREFLDRIYVNNLQTLNSGRVRYGLMLRENGVVMDDGAVTCIDPETFFITSTSGQSENLHLWLREWSQCEWPDMRVLVTPLTTALGTLTLSGPKSRAVLERTGTDVNLSPAAFPHMSARLGRVAGLPARILRVSFTGELGYEIYVDARRSGELWRALWTAGREESIRAYGIKASDLMRTEKGFLIVGSDTDATTTPLDLGWRDAIAKKSGDFVGRGALSLPEYQRSDRLELVGIKVAMAADSAAIVNGAHLIQAGLRRSEGYLTSVTFSPTLGHFLGLARLERGRQRIGEQLLAYDQGVCTPVQVVEPNFYDPLGSRFQA